MPDPHAKANTIRRAISTTSILGIMIKKLENGKGC